MTTLYVVYARGTVAALLPLALSLLRAPGARFVLVDNACTPEESRQLSRLAASEERFAYHRLPLAEPADHGTALNHLVSESDEQHFGIVDSDVLATGDFVTELLPKLETSAAACGGWPVWLADAESVCADLRGFLGGPYRTLADGTEVGGTSCALYDRLELAQALQALPRGLARQSAEDLPAPVRAAFGSRGWDFHRFGTARAAHLYLLATGNSVANVDLSTLHHIGGVSHVGDLVRTQVARKMARGPRAPFLNFLASLGRRAGSRGRERAGAYRRKKQVLAYVDALLTALRDGHPPPAPPATGSEEVDERVGALVRALVADYRGFCERVEDPESQ